MRRGVAASRPLRVAALATVALVALLAVVQLVAPGIAASTIESRVRRYGDVLSASVSAWPAVELLWGKADRVTVHAGSLRLSPAQSAKLIWEGRDVARVDARAASVQEGPLHLTGVVFAQRGSRLRGEASLSDADVRASLPPGVDVRLLGSGDGQVRVRVSGGLFGVGGSLEAVALGECGALVARPLSPGFATLRLTLFSDPHVYVEGVEASAVANGGYRLSMTARLR
jgi:hypothetical protein